MKGLPGSIKWFDVFNYTFMLFFSFTILYPFWDMLILSLSDPKISSLTIRLWPTGFTLDSYMYAFRNDSIIMAYAMSIYRTVCGTLLTILLISLAAYTLSKRDLPLRMNNNQRNHKTTVYYLPYTFDQHSTTSSYSQPDHRQMKL